MMMSHCCRLSDIVAPVNRGLQSSSANLGDGLRKRLQTDVAGISACDARQASMAAAVCFERLLCR